MKQKFTKNSHLSDKAVAIRCEISRATVWRWVKENKFPKPIKLSAGSTRWKLSDIEAWEAKREAQ